LAGDAFRRAYKEDMSSKKCLADSAGYNNYRPGVALLRSTLCAQVIPSATWLGKIRTYRIFVNPLIAVDHFRVRKLNKISHAKKRHCGNNTKKLESIDQHGLLRLCEFLRLVERRETRIGADDKVQRSEPRMDRTDIKPVDGCDNARSVMLDGEPRKFGGADTLDELSAFESIVPIDQHGAKKCPDFAARVL
jgi:hypothetical protein